MKNFTQLTVGDYLKQIFSIDLRSLALFRISMGLVLLVDLIIRMGSIEAFYSDLGVMPRSLISGVMSRSMNVSIHFITGSATLQTLLFLINGIFILCFIVGYRTRLMSFLCWFFYISLINRNPLIVHGGDVVVRNILFWSMFVPMHLGYSVDSALRKNPQPDKKIFSPGTLALMVQLLYVYFFSGIHKSHAQWFPEGTAIAYALQLHSFATPIGIFMRQFPFILKILTISTYLLELYGPLVMLIPFRNMLWRTPIILGFIGLHFGIFLTMKIGMFPWMCIAAWMMFIPSEFWDWVAPRIRKRGQDLKIYFDADCGFCKKSVYILRQLLLIKHTQIEEGQSNPEVWSRMQSQNSWVVQSGDGTLYDRYDAFPALVQASPFSFLAFFFRSAPIHWIGSKIYRWVSNNRSTAGYITGPLQWTEKTYSYSKMNLLLVIFFLSLVTLNNLGGLKFKNLVANHLFQTPDSLKPFNKILRVDQSWDMFAPKPMGTNSWYFIYGNTFSDREVILLNEDPRENPKRPADFQNLFPSHRWSKFTRNLTEEDNEDYILNYGRYLCRKTNRDLAGKDKLERFTIKLIKQKTSLGEPNPYRETVLWKHKCSGARELPPVQKN